MADVKIADLPVADPLTGVEEVPIVQTILGNPTTVITTAQDISNFITSSITLQTVLVSHNLVNGNNFQGTLAGDANSGTNVIGIGANAAQTNSGNSVVALGQSTALNNSGLSVVAFIGGATGNTGNSVLAFGGSAASYNTGTNVVALMDEAAQSNAGSNVIAIGQTAGDANPYNNVIMLGANAAASAANQLAFSNGAGLSAQFSNTNLSANRKYELPNVAGTLALVNTSAFTGVKTIGGQVYTWTNGILISVV